MRTPRAAIRLTLLASSLLGTALLGTSLRAQRDAPVWECYLASTTIRHGKDKTLDLRLLFKKEGGPYEHTEHQMYLLAYLQKDEKAVMKIANDPKLLDKDAGKDKKLFLDVLLERRLVTVLDTKVSKRSAAPAQDVTGKYRDGTDQSKDPLLRNAMDFRFTVKKNALFQKASKLKGFDPKNFVQSDRKYFNDMLKFLVFVPVNDCRYSTKIEKKLQTTHDFAHFDPSRKDDFRQTPKLYFKPLSWVLQFKELEKGEYLVYVN